MTKEVEDNGVVAKEIKRRRLEDLSFSSPGPAFLGTPSSSDAGDEDSDQGIRKRPARLRIIDRTGAMKSSSSSSSYDNTSEGSIGMITPKPPLIQPPRQPSVIRSNNYKPPSSIFRNFDSPSSPNGKGKVNTPRISNGHKKGEVNGDSRHANANGSHHSAQHLTNGATAGASNGHGIRKGATSITGPSAHPSSTYSPSTRTLGRSRRPSSRTRDYDEAYHTPSRPRSSSQTLLPKSTTKQGSQTKREQLLQKKKEELDQVYKEHDGLVRELFHLSKFVTYFGYDPELAARDRSDVFERFRMDYDLPTKLSGGSGRATRRIVSAKRGDLELVKSGQQKENADSGLHRADEKKESSTSVKKVANGGPSSTSKAEKGKQKEEVNGKTKRGPGRPRKSSYIDVNSSSEESSGIDSDGNGTEQSPLPLKKSKKRGNRHESGETSSNPSDDDNRPAVKRKVGRPRKKSPSVEYVPQEPVIMERIQGIPRIRVMQPSHLPLRPKHGRSLGAYLQSWHTTGEILGGGAGELEVVPLSLLHQKERRDAYFYNAIDQAKAEGLLQDRNEAARKSLQNRASEPQRRVTPWDVVLQEMSVESSKKRVETRNKVASCKRVARMVLLYWDEKLGRGEKQRKMEERRIRAMAKFVVREVRKEWKMAVTIVKDRRAKLEKQEKDRVGREQLKTILEQSTQMLGKQHRVLVQGEADSDRSGERDSDSEDESEEIDSDSSLDEEVSGLSGDEAEVESEGGEVKDAEAMEVDELDHPSTPPLSESIIEGADNGRAKQRSTKSPMIVELGSPDKEDQIIEFKSGSQEKEATKPFEVGSPFDERNDEAVKIKPPFLLRGNLRPYQQIGFEWLANLYNNGSNGILADEMGLGKTIQTIALLAHLACDKGEWGPHLVVAPTSVMLNWEVEFKKFFPAFKILSYYGSQKERKEKRRGWNSDNHFNVCITSYQLVLADQHILRRKAWQYLILDEAHHIKNFKSQRWQTLLGFNSKRRLLLTGTPLQNNLMDLWSLMYFLMPNGITSTDGVVNSGFASMKEFQQWFSNPLGKAVENAGMEGEDGEVDDETRGMVSKLHTLLRPYLLRRLKMEVEKEMPNKYEHVIKCRLSKRQKFLYNDFMSRAKTRESLASGNYLSIINCLMQLRKVCNHPDLFEQRPIVTSFAAQRSVVADFEIKDLLVRKELLQLHNEEQVDLNAINLRFNLSDNRHLTPINTRSLARLDASGQLSHDEVGQPILIDTWSIEGYKTSMAKQRQAAKALQWKHKAYVNHLRCQAQPPRLFDVDSVAMIESFVNIRHLLPIGIAQNNPREFLHRCDGLNRAVLSYDERRQGMQDVIDRFAFVTPRAVTNDINRWALPGLDHETMPNEMMDSCFDTLHQPAVKLQIAFPDASLLQYDCGKLQELALLMQRCKAGGHRILIFTQMTKILDILEIWLSLNGFKYLRLDGSTKVEDRQALTERYNRDDRITAFILSTRSGGLGINLTGADMVLFWDLDWNFQIEAQCMDRAHRIGQTRDVHIYRFVSEHTIEENMLKKSNEKRMLDNMVIRNGQFTTEGLSKMSWIESMFDEGGKTIAGVQVGNNEGIVAPTNDRRVETAMDQAEDEEDANAAKSARAELHLLDDDFETELNQDKLKQQPALGAEPSQIVNESQQQVQSELAVEDNEENEDADGIASPVEDLEVEMGTYGDYMLKRVDEDWDYFVNL